MRSAIVEKGIVTNVIVGSIEGSIECSPEVGIGFIFDGEQFTPPSTSVLPPLTDEEKRAAMPDLTARQFRLGLVNAGISPSTVTATIAAMPDGPEKDKDHIEWEYATTFKRTHPLVTSIGASIGLSPEDIDAIWRSSALL